ncbi:MAG: 50S ribosomal protein L11 methyltransferase, partial [Oceanococcus sp.]
FDGDIDLRPLRDGLVSAGLCPAEHVRLEGLEERAWEREWLKDFQPMAFGQRLWVSPHKAEQVWPDSAVVLRMDPGLAFGTGTHPTTRLCLSWLDAHDLRGKTVIDYGCGSGVLAVAAALLGAEHVVAFDIDPQAMLATRDNARANGVEGKLTYCSIDQAPTQAADIVVANILAGTLIDLQAAICALVKPQGELVLSGILAEHAQTVVDAYTEQFLLTPENSEAWVRLSGTRFAR